jgi:hypothetical protein
MVPKKPLSIFALLLIWLLSSQQVAAQCAMCRAVLESNGDNAVAEGINNGIVYLMAIPYILVGVIIFVVYRKVKA